MASDFDQFDEEFDDSLDDLLDSDSGDGALSNEPTTKREAVVNTLTDTSKGFINSYKDEPLENISKVVQASLPSEISGEVSDIADISASIKDEYINVAKEVKKKARSTFSVVKRILPKSELSNKISDRLESYLGKEEESSRRPSKEELEQQAIAGNINSTIGEDKIASLENLFKDTLEQNRFKTVAELNNITASTLREISLFNKQVTHKYYTKSLELQYKSVFIAKEQLNLAKVMGDTFKNQLESIVKNTSLPDIIKLKSSEAIKSELRRKATNDLAKKMFSDGTLLGNTKERIAGIGNNLKDELLGSLDTVGDLAEQKEMMDGMVMPGISKGDMAGSFLADGLNSILGNNISRKIANSEAGKKAMYNIKNVMGDPSAYLNKAADKIGYDSYLKTRMGDGVRFASDVLKTNNKLTNITVGKDDLNDVKMFDGRAYNSLTKVIPGLLSKIYGEIKSFRTKDNNPEANEITYDYDKSTFIGKTEVTSNLKDKLTTRINATSNIILQNLVSDFIDKGGYEVNSKKDIDTLNKVITAYVIKGRPLVPALFKEYGFIELASKGQQKKLEKSLDKMNIVFSNDTYANEYFIRNLKEYKNSLPNIVDELTSVIDSGNGGELVKNGIMSYDEVYGTYSTNEESLTNLYLDAIKNTHNDIEFTSKQDVNDIADKINASKSGATKVSVDINDSKPKLPETNITDKVKEVKTNTTSNVTKETKSKLNNKLDKAKSNITDKAKEAKAILDEKVEEVIPTEEELDALKDDFLDSKAFTNGKSFKDYLNALGIKFVDAKNYLVKLARVYKEKLVKAKEFMLDRLNPMLKTLTVDEEEVLKKEYIESGAVEKGVTFNKYLKAFGYRPKLNMKQTIKAILKKTRAWDRKIALAAVKLPGKGIKKLFSRKKKATDNDGVVLNKETLKTIVRETTSGVLAKNKPKKNKFDKDGDGDRDGNWKDRLKGMFGKNESVTKDKRKKGLLQFAKDNKGLSSTAILTGVLIAMKSMGISMDDVVKFAKGMWDGIKDIGSALAWVGGIIKKAFNGISGVLKGIGSFLGISTGDEIESNDSAMDTGKAAAYGVGGLAAYKAGKAISGVTGKVTPKKTTANLAKKGTDALTKKVSKKGLAKKILSFLSNLKTTISKKFGPVLASKLLGKIASRFVPILGWGLLLYDAGKIAYDMSTNGTPFKNATSKQILGFDIYEDELPVDEDGKPLDNPELEKKALDKVKMQALEPTNDVDDKIPTGAITNSSMLLKPTNNTTYKTNMSINKKVNSIGDGEDKPSGGVPANNKTFGGSGNKEVKVRKGDPYPADGGDDNIITKSGVSIEQLNPAMLTKLQSMANEYNEITGKKILINSGYRSTADQIKLRKKYGSRAARPGYSTHEFGLAVDINGSTLDELEDLGLLGKYKMTRPVGGEKWHVEPSGIQLDVNNSKKDPNYAAALIDKVPIGGSGWGTVSGVRKYSRNRDYQKDLLTEPKIKLIGDDKVDSADNMTTTPSFSLPNITQSSNTASGSVLYTGKNSDIGKKDLTSSVSTVSKAISDNSKAKMDTLVKPISASADIAKSANIKLGNIHTTLQSSLEVQTQMLKALDTLNKKEINEVDETITSVNNVKRNAPNIDRSGLPNPAINIARTRY